MRQGQVTRAAAASYMSALHVLACYALFSRTAQSMSLKLCQSTHAGSRKGSLMPTTSKLSRSNAARVTKRPILPKPAALKLQQASRHLVAASSVLPVRKPVPQFMSAEQVCVTKIWKTDTENGAFRLQCSVETGSSCNGMDGVKTSAPLMPILTLCASSSMSQTALATQKATQWCKFDSRTRVAR